MRIVLDTNVLMSGIFWKGTPRKLLEAWQDGRITLVTSAEIMDEYERVEAILRERFPRSAQYAAEIMRHVLTHAEVVAAPALPAQVCTDPDDDKFIACTLAAANVDCIVTGDKALLVGGPKAGVLTMTPRECLTDLK